MYEDVKCNPYQFTFCGKASLSLDAESEFEYGFRHETLLFRDDGGILELQFVKPIIRLFAVMPAHAGIQKP
jgi:hypothetical protein